MSGFGDFRECFAANPTLSLVQLARVSVGVVFSTIYLYVIIQK